MEALSRIGMLSQRFGRPVGIGQVPARDAETEHLRRHVLPHALGRPLPGCRLPLDFDLDEPTVNRRVVITLLDVPGIAASGPATVPGWSEVPSGDRGWTCRDRRVAERVADRCAERNRRRRGDGRQARDFRGRVRQQDAHARQREESLRVDVPLRRRAGVLAGVLQGPAYQLDHCRVRLRRWRRGPRRSAGRASSHRCRRCECCSHTSPGKSHPTAVVRCDRRLKREGSFR